MMRHAGTAHGRRRRRVLSFLTAFLILFCCACKDAGPENSGSQTAEAFYQSTEGTVFSGERFDVRVYPAALKRNGSDCDFTYRIDLWNKSGEPYRKLDVRVEYTGELGQYVNGPTDLGPIRLDGDNGSPLYILEAAVGVASPGAQREAGIAEGEIVAGPQDAAILQGKAAGATIIFQKGKERWEIPFSFQYQTESEKPPM